MRDHRLLAAAATTLVTTLIGTFVFSGYPPKTPQSTYGEVVAGRSNPVVAVVGDSIESGTGLQQFEAWPALVAVDRRWNLHNFSSPGAGFVANDSENKDFAAQFDHAIAIRPDIVLIGASDNDRGDPTDVIASAMSAMIERLRDALPHASLIGFSVLSGEADDTDLPPLNDALRTALTTAQGRWLDLGEPYRGHDDLTQDDGEHPTAAGQQAIASLVLARMGETG